MYKVPTFSCFIQINGALLKCLPWVHTIASSWQGGFILCLPTLSTTCHERAKTHQSPRWQLRANSLRAALKPGVTPPHLPTPRPPTPAHSVIWQPISLSQKSKSESIYPVANYNISKCSLQPGSLLLHLKIESGEHRHSHAPLED